jgi:hypothetical protein
MATAATQKGRREALGNDERYRHLLAKVQFPEEAAWAPDMPVAPAFKTALCEEIRFEDPDRLRVRCSITRDDANGLRYMCKVDIAASPTESGPHGYAWSWWSPLVENPAGLLTELRRALRLRHTRLRAAYDARKRYESSAAADKTRGPAHGTFSTELWDLGRAEQADGFCRNRRARWTSYAAGSRPLRPRYPR